MNVTALFFKFIAVVVVAVVMWWVWNQSQVCVSAVSHDFFYCSNQIDQYRYLAIFSVMKWLLGIMVGMSFVSWRTYKLWLLIFLPILVVVFVTLYNTPLSNLLNFRLAPKIGAISKLEWTTNYGLLAALTSIAFVICLRYLKFYKK